MAPEERSPEWEVGLVAAARTAASWAHARRAAWTDTPLLTPEVTASPAVSDRQASSVSPPIVPAPAALASSIILPSPMPPFSFETPVLAAPAVPVTLDVPPRTPPSAADRAREAAHSAGALVVPWLPRAAAAVAVIAGVSIGGMYLWKALPSFNARVRAPEPSKAAVAVPARKVMAGLHVTSTPTGAQVVVDGKPRGVTPLTLTDLAPGRHNVAITGGAGSVQRVVTLAAGENVEIAEGIFSGWAAVYAPFDLTISEGGRVLRPDERNQMMLPPGTHDLRLVNRALGFDETRKVDVKPGDTTVVRLSPPASSVALTTTEPSEVWWDGARLGETPLDPFPAALGSHDLLVKRAAGGERRFTVTVGVRPFTLNVAF